MRGRVGVQQRRSRRWQRFNTALPCAHDTPARGNSSTSSTSTAWQRGYAATESHGRDATDAYHPSRPSLDDKRARGLD